MRRALAGVIGLGMLALSLAGCTTQSHAFTADTAQDVLFGATIQAQLMAEGLTPASATVSTETVGAYVTSTAGGVTPTFDPRRCGNSARLLILADVDATSRDTLYILPKFSSGATSVSVKARLFDDESAAQSFVTEFQAANSDCAKFTSTESDQTVDVALTVSEAIADGGGFRLDTVATAGTSSAFLSYVLREGNLVVAVQGASATSAAASLLASTADLYRTALTH